VSMSAGEHQGCLRLSMLAEDWEHPALIFGTQMKETVPSQNAVTQPGE
jgi:hypothetical protein